MLSASELIKTQTLSSPENSNILNVFGFQRRMKIHKQTVTNNFQIILFGCVKLSSFNTMKILSQEFSLYYNTREKSLIFQLGPQKVLLLNRQEWRSLSQQESALGICLMHLSSSEHGATPNRRGWILQEQQRTLKARLLMRIMVLMHWKTYDIWLIAS